MWTLSDILVSYNRVGTRPAPTRWQVTEGIVLREHDIRYKEGTLRLRMVYIAEVYAAQCRMEA
jgi:hypothetical protein